MVAVVHVERGLDVVFVEFYGVGTVAVERVLEVAAASDFPAIVDVAACSECKRDCTQGDACFFVESQIHAPKVEIIFGLNIL